MSLSLLQEFWCLFMVREASNGFKIWCFFMPWWSRDHLRLILYQFRKKHFFHKDLHFFDRNLVPQKLICISITWSIWEYPDLKQLKTQKPNETYRILPSRCWEKQKTKLKRDLNQEPKISQKFSIRGNYSWAYLL